MSVRAAVVSGPARSPSSASPIHLCSKSIRLIGSTNHPYTGYGPALKLLERHGETAGFRELVSHRVPLDEVERALLTSLEPESAKVLVAP